MTRETLLKRYKILRYNQRGGNVFYKVKKKCWCNIFWRYAYEEHCVYGNCYKVTLILSTYDETIKWIDKDIENRLSDYNSDVVTIDKFESLVKENIYLKELTELLEAI